MIGKFEVFALVVLYVFGAASGQDCIASSVLNLRIAADATLSWEQDPNDPCDVEEFQVDVTGDRDDEYHFKVRDTYVDLSFLEICEEWVFVVTPISDGVPGFERRLTENIPLPPSADISLVHLNLTELSPRDILLEWDLLNHTHGDCTLRYRVTIEDLDDGQIHDLYVTQKSVHLTLLSPCVPYHITVRAVNRAHPTIEGPRRYYDYEIEPTPEEPPTVRSVTIGSTEVDLTFRLENPGRNRCPIRTLYIDAGTHFNLALPLEDTPERPPVDVHLGGLQPNSMYFLKVSVENSGGVSNPAQIGVQTLDLSPGSE